MRKKSVMDPILAFSLIGLALLVYAIYFGAAPDELDKNGNPKRKRRKDL